MRHRIRTRKLSRHIGHKRALIRNLLMQLYNQESIVTTMSKAKAIQPIADKLIYKAQKPSVHQNRHLNSILNSQDTVFKLVKDISPRYNNLSSGYTRMIKLGRRRGDDAMMVRLELTNRTSVLATANKETEKKKKAEPKKADAKPAAKKTESKATKTNKTEKEDK